jgi:predicted RNase H-like HicB family nuclease
MELTIKVHREDHTYSAEITRTDVWELQGRWTSARTLSELVDYLEDAIQLCLDDDSARLLTRQLEVGTMRVTLSREGA